MHSHHLKLATNFEECIAQFEEVFKINKQAMSTNERIHFCLGMFLFHTNISGYLRGQKESSNDGIEDVALDLKSKLDTLVKSIESYSRSDEVTQFHILFYFVRTVRQTIDNLKTNKN